MATPRIVSPNARAADHWAKLVIGPGVEDVHYTVGLRRSRKCALASSNQTQLSSAVQLEPGSLFSGAA